MSLVGHKPPPSFVIGATGPPSIADEMLSPRQVVANVEVIRANPRQVLPRNRPPWRAAVASATGQNRKSLSMPLRPVLLDADMKRSRSLRTRATPQAWWPLPTELRPQVYPL